MILVANKVDLMHLRKITREQGKEMATKHNVGGVCVCVCVCVCVRVGVGGSGDVSVTSLLQSRSVGMARRHPRSWAGFHSNGACAVWDIL